MKVHFPRREKGKVILWSSVLEITKRIVIMMSCGLNSGKEDFQQGIVGDCMYFNHIVLYTILLLYLINCIVF